MMVNYIVYIAILKGFVKSEEKSRPRHPRRLKSDEIAVAGELSFGDSKTVPSINTKNP